MTAPRYNASRCKRRTLAVLRDRAAKDPDTYIRAQSAAAIRELGPHQKF